MVQRKSKKKKKKVSRKSVRLSISRDSAVEIDTASSVDLRRVPEASLVRSRPPVSSDIFVRDTGQRPQVDRVEFAQVNHVVNVDSKDGNIMKISKFFVSFFLLTSAGVLAVGAYFFFFHGRASGDVVLELEAPKEIERGVPFPLRLSLENNSDGLLGDARLSLLVPRDVVILERDANGQLLKQSFGDVQAGNVEKKTFQLVAISLDKGEKADETAKITARLSYSLGKSSGFEAEGSAEVRLLSPAIAVELQRDDNQVLGGSAFWFNISYSNVSDTDLEDLRMEVQYPDAFSYISADLPPDSLNNFWKLGALRAGSKGKLAIQGRLSGADNTEFPFPVRVYGSFLDKNYLISETEVGFAVAPSPLELQVLVNGSEEYVARPGEELTYTIRYTNLSGVALSDLTILGSFLGEMYDFSTLDSGLTLDSRSRLRWDKANVPALLRLEAGGSGEVQFRVKLKSQYPIARLSDKNFRLRASVLASSPTVPYYLSGDKTRVLREVITKIQGAVDVDARAYYRDSDSGMVNGGTLPPRVGEETEYTVHWLLRNYSTDVRNAHVRATLPYGVEWTGHVKSDTETLPLYDELTREVSWEVPEISATKGVLNPPLQAIFQVRVRPDASLVGKLQPLLDETTLTATDDFTGVTLQANDFGLNTLLSDDATVGAGQGIVVE